MNEQNVVTKKVEHEVSTSQTLPQEQMRKEDAPKESFDQKLGKFFKKYPKRLWIGWSIVVLLFLILIPAAYFSWYILTPKLFYWANHPWWHWIPAFFGFSFLFMIPIWVAQSALSLVSKFTDISLAIEEAADHKVKVRETEEDAIRRLEKTDTAGLLPLLKYSRAQLDEYYNVALRQTRRSFFSSVLAMWLGFILLLVGIALYVGPVEKLGLKVPNQDFSIIIMGGAAIIEFISALFLWVYQSSTHRLIFFYNSQKFTHTATLCFRIASTMEKAKGDETKEAIVKKVMEWTSLPENTPIPGAKGLHSFLPKAEPKATS